MKRLTNKQRCKKCTHRCVCPDISYFANVDRLGERCNHYSPKRNLKTAKTEAVKEFAEKTHKMITEIYNKHIFGNNDLNAEEKDAIINFSDDITYRLEKLEKEMEGDA